MSEAMPLSHLRVVEVGGLPAASYCARLLADLGAEVIRVEPPGGDPARALAPTIGGTSALFGVLNYGKTCVTGDAAALIAAADICIDSRPDRHAWRPLPDLIHVDVSWFGRSGPYAGFAATDAVCRALAGLLHLAGPADGPPVGAPDGQAAIIGGLWGCIGVLACVFGRQAGDRGRALELSVHEGCIALGRIPGVGSGDCRAGRTHRLGINRFQPTFPLGIYPAKDDWIGITLITPAQWRDFCLLVGLPDLAEAPGLILGMERLPRAAELEAAFMPLLLERTAAEWFALGLQHRLPIVPVPSMAELVAHEPFRTRRAVVPIAFGSTVAHGPGAPLGLSHTPTTGGGTVPPIATGPAEFRPRAQQPAARRRAPGLPLRGMRVIDLTMGWAGPLATRTLADLGADVVKIEACQYTDWWRGVDTRPEALATRKHERTGRFVVMNRNKRGITLDLTAPEGVAIVRRLVADADAVVENYSTGVLPKFGLSYAHLHAVNPGLVMASMSAYGATGPWRECRAYGSTLEHGSGLPRLVGEPDAPPTMGHLAFGDAIGGLNATVALMAALLHRKRTGEGQHIDLSQIECMLPFTAVPMLLQSTGTPPARTGNRHPGQAPHGVFPCAGADRWVLVAVAEDAHWPGLCRAIGRPDLLADPALRTLPGRQAHAAQIERAIAAWTRQQSPAEAMAALQAQGVPAGAVISPGALHEDRHLIERGFWQWRTRAEVGRHPQASLPFREAAVPYPVRWPAPTLGQHTEAVLAGLLGMTPAEIAALAAAGIIGTEPQPQRRRVAQPA